MSSFYLYSVFVLQENNLKSFTDGFWLLKFGLMAENEKLRAVMSQRARQAAKPNASTEIAQHILSLVNSRT